MEALPMHVSQAYVNEPLVDQTSSKNVRSSGASLRSSTRASSRMNTTLPLFRNCSSAVPEYFSRVLDYRQMDLEATYYQMVTLCIAPSKVYKSAYYRKQTKNRWARDDPAFAVIQVIFLFVACLAWTVAFEKTSSLAFLLLCDVVIEWFVLGMITSYTMF
ncbi:transmembrane protein [Thraustotheca clavata]|uniref:Transmembrane protein n=1 Tax=Thraustotheca clavata TaxID=74557 RepID=A0A1V9YJM1_9STRA|nr:transmembrane protein [Thraustotheca clavata]